MRIPLLAAVLLAAAACGSHASSPVSNVGGPMPTGPAPSVGTEAADGDFSSAFTATGLPAIPNDGKAVVLAVMGEDGARGAPNLAIVQKDRSDAETYRLVVATPDDASMTDDDTAPPPPTAKLAEANKYLTETHGSRGWFALTPMEMVEVEAVAEDDAPAYGSAKTAHAGDLVLTWDEGKVLLTGGGKTLVDRQTNGWTAPVGERACDDCELCSNPSFLANAWIDPARKLIVARISYVGNDTCWEPDSEDHVIAW